METRVSLFLVFLCAIVFFGTTVQAKDDDKLVQRIEKAAEVLDEIIGIKEKGIPRSLIEKSEAIIIIPSVYKGGLGLGGRYGKGMMCSRYGEGGSWSAPIFVRIKGGSFGLQIGVQSTDFVLLIMNKKGLKGLLKSKFTLGADASIAAGPVGRGAEASTDASLEAEIYSYSRSRGAFIGISLEGAVLSAHEKANRGFYDGPVSASDVLLEGTIPPPEAARPLIKALNKCCPARSN